MGKRKKVFYVYKPPVEEFYSNSPFSLEIRPSLIPGAGRGVFTLEEIPEQKMIGEYTGDRNYYILSGQYFLGLGDGSGINAESFPRSYMAMLNDAYKSNLSNNCYFKILSKTERDEARAEIWSIRKIEIGEELLISYGDEYWNR